jgi:hypothetical protein
MDFSDQKVTWPPDDRAQSRFDPSGAQARALTQAAGREMITPAKFLLTSFIIIILLFPYFVYKK